MYEEPSKLQTAHAPSSPTVERTRGFKVLADDFEKTMLQLREDVMSLNSIISPALRPEPPPGCDKICENEPVRAELETWLVEQLSVARSCIERIQSYKDRCVI